MGKVLCNTVNVFGNKEQLGVMINTSHYYTNRGSDNWERDGKRNLN